LGAASDPSPFVSLIQGFLGLEPSQLCVLVQLICAVMGKLEPILRVLGVYNAVSDLIDRYLIAPLTGLSAGGVSRDD